MYRYTLLTRITLFAISFVLHTMHSQDHRNIKKAHRFHVIFPNTVRSSISHGRHTRLSNNIHWQHYNNTSVTDIYGSGNKHTHIPKHVQSSKQISSNIQALQEIIAHNHQQKKDVTPQCSTFTFPPFDIRSQKQKKRKKLKKASQRQKPKNKSRESHSHSNTTRSQRQSSNTSKMYQQVSQKQYSKQLPTLPSLDILRKHGIEAWYAAVQSYCDQNS